MTKLPLRPANEGGDKAKEECPAEASNGQYEGTVSAENEDEQREKDLSTKYKYSKIEPSEIRCVRFGPRRGDYHECQISTVSRDSGDYIALSYAWGSPTADAGRKVIIPGQGYLNLTKNLDDAISSLEKASKRILTPNIFFIDQLSINQDDIEEKSVQVAHMSQVYLRARKVIIYLGPSEEGDGEAIAFLKQKAAVYLSQFSTLEKLKAFHKSSIMRQLGHVPEDSDFQIPEKNPEMFRQLQRMIYCSGWVYRLWMFQETVLNKLAFFLRGSELIGRWEVLDFILWHLYVQPGETERAFHEGRFAATTLARQFRGFSPIKQKTLDFFINDYSGMLKCYDPRDKVYAILGIPQSNWGIVPDYRASVRTVYIDLFQKSLEHLGKLSFLNGFHKGSNLPAPPVDAIEGGRSWPTWLPRLTCGFHQFPMGKATGSTSPIAYIPPQNEVLIASGLEIGQVEHVLGFVRGFLGVRQKMPLQFARTFMTHVTTVRNVLSQKGISDADSKFCEIFKDDHLQTNHIYKGLNSREREASAFKILLTFLSDAIAKPLSDPIDISAALLPPHEKEQMEAILAKLRNDDFNMCITTDGQLLLTDPRTRQGDIVAALFGGDLLYILRPGAGNDVCSYSGIAYIPELSDGQIVQDAEWEEELRKLAVKSLLGELELPPDNPTIPIETSILLSSDENNKIEFNGLQDFGSLIPLVMRRPEPATEPAAAPAAESADESAAELVAGSASKEQFLDLSPENQLIFIRLANQTGPTHESLKKIAPLVRILWWKAIWKLFATELLPLPEKWKTLKTYKIV